MELLWENEGCHMLLEGIYGDEYYEEIKKKKEILRKEYASGIQVGERYMCVDNGYLTVRELIEKNDWLLRVMRQQKGQ